MNNTINKRITYSYFDYKNGILQSCLDIDLEVDDTNEVIELTPGQLQKYVSSKWAILGYDNGDIRSVEQLYID